MNDSVPTASPFECKTTLLANIFSSPRRGRENDVREKLFLYYYYYYYKQNITLGSMDPQG